MVRFHFDFRENPTFTIAHLRQPNWGDYFLAIFIQHFDVPYFYTGVNDTIKQKTRGKNGIFTGSTVHLLISQTKIDAEKSLVLCKINGQKVAEWINNKAKSFEEMYVYASDPWYRDTSSIGKISKLVVSDVSPPSGTFRFYLPPIFCLLNFAFLILPPIFCLLNLASSILPPQFCLPYFASSILPPQFFLPYFASSILPPQSCLLNFASHILPPQFCLLNFASSILPPQFFLNFP